MQHGDRQLGILGVDPTESRLDLAEIGVARREEYRPGLPGNLANQLNVGEVEAGQFEPGNVGSQLLDRLEIEGGAHEVDASLGTPLRQLGVPVA